MRYDGERMYFAYPGLPLDPPSLSALSKAQGIILTAKTLAEKQDSQFILVYAPTKFRVFDEFCKFPTGSIIEEWDANDLQDKMRDWASEQGVAYIDLTESFVEASSKGKLTFFVDDGHWNAEGNAVVANTIKNFLHESEILKKKELDSIVKSE